MHRLMVFLVFVSACGSGQPPALNEPRGRLVVTAEPGGELLNTAARAVACPRDSTMAVVAVGDRWAAAIAIRGLPPADSERLLDLLPSLDSGPSAVLALRSLGDSLQSLLPSNGTVRLIAGDSLRGTFDARMIRDSAPLRLTGRFSAPLPADTCQ